MSGRDVELALVVLNWNGVGDTVACLASLRQSTLPVYAIVVDNGSEGDDVAQLRRSGLADRIVEAGENLGYAGGNNLGLKLALEEGFRFVGVLNNDTVVEPSAMHLLVNQLSDSVSAQIALSPDIRYFDDSSRSWFAGGVIDRGWPRHLQSAELCDRSQIGLRDSECLTGCCIVAKAEIWARVGLFDPRYFVIFEDSDWSIRARSAGVSLYVATEARIFHRVSRSFASVPSSLLGDYYFVRNGLLFEWTHARRYLPRFAFRWLIRPTLSNIFCRGRGHALVFRWLGVLAFVTARTGRASKRVESIAARRGAG